MAAGRGRPALHCYSWRSIRQFLQSLQKACPARVRDHNVQMVAAGYFLPSSSYIRTLFFTVSYSSPDIWFHGCTVTVASSVGMRLAGGNF
jgi:hypothetical protein